MRYLLLSIFVLMAAQPLQASFCDMSADQSHSYSKMSEDGMHAGMAHDIDGGSHNQKMDCCNEVSAASDHNCSAMSHCGACPAGWFGRCEFYDFFNLARHLSR